jgi:predicted DNA-binding transcriptional regulator YafY
MTRDEAAAYGRSVWSEIRASRIEDYLWIGGDRMSASQAARRIGVSQRTVVRYRATLRAQREQVAA